LRNRAAGESIMLRRRGFTLVELLVVIAIIGVLIALLLPAVQAAREAARRTTCLNHLRQLGVACQLHHSAHKFFPSGGGPDYTWHMTYIGGRPAHAPLQHGSWAFQILPYIEASDVWEGVGGATDIDKSIIAISTPQAVLFCPSRRPPEVVVAKDWYTNPSTNRTFGHAKNDYAASSLNTSSTKAAWKRGIGAITRMTPTRGAEVTDGLSKTMLLGEKRVNLPFMGSMFANDNEGYTCGWNHDTLRNTEVEPLADYVGVAGDTGGDRFGSSHPGVFGVVMADTTTKMVSYEISLETFKRMGHRADGKSGGGAGE